MYLIKKVLISLIVLLVLLNSPTNASAKQKLEELRFVVNAPGSFPYLYMDDDSNRYIGLVPHLLSDMGKDHNLKIQYIHSNQLRSEKMLITGQADLYLVNPQWLREPDRVLVSETLVSHSTYLYATKPFEQDFAIATIEGAQICTRENYVYTGLSNYFQRDIALRIDAPNDQTMLNMLAGNRCDYLIKNDYNAMRAFASQRFCNMTIYQSPQPTSVVPLTIILRAELIELKDTLDHHIRTARRNGYIQRFLSHHTKPPVFPMLVTC